MQLCPKCDYNNSNDVKNCKRCSAELRDLLGRSMVLAKRYRITGVLGCGAMGAVYLAKDKRLVTRHWAVKEHRPDPRGSTEMLSQLSEQFLAEAGVMAQLDHPALPKVSDYFVERKREYLVMDYVEGEDLLTRLEKTGMPLLEEQVVDWSDQILDALAYLHAQKPRPIIHRDIKPANIRVTPAGRIKLVDFGLVKLLDTSNPATMVELRGIVTPAYSPLEQFPSSADHTDSRSDVYALGATMYHLLTGTYPTDVQQRLVKPGSLKPPRRLNPQLSKHIERVMLRAMEIQPSERYQSAADMRRDLSKQGRGVTASLPDIKPIAGSVSSASGMKRILAFVAVIGVIAALVGISFMLITGTEEDDVTPQAVAVETQPAAPVAPAATNTPAPSQTPSPAASTAEEITVPTTTNTPTQPAEATEEPKVVGIPPTSLTGVIAYPVFNNTSYDLYFGQVDGSGNQLFRSQASQPAFSADGSRIALHSWQPDARGLMTMDLAGNQGYLVTTFVEDQLPTWSTNGGEIIFVTRRAGGHPSELARVNSSQERGEVATFVNGEYPTISPNGQLVYKDWGTGTGLRLASAAFDNVQTITEIGEDTAPALSPDGQKIAFMSRRDGNWEIYIINSDGTNLQRLTDNPGQDGLPTWSPDGEALAFVSQQNGNWAVWVMTPAGEDKHSLFKMEGSPDGSADQNSNASRGWTEERISWKK